jgi:uncharacterized repeat protein (TIGR01451 family)
MIVSLAATSTLKAADESTHGDTVTTRTPEVSVAGPAWALAVSASPEALVVSNSVTYAYHLTNLWGVPLTNVVVRSTLPASAQFLSATASTGATTNNAGVVTFRVDALADGGSALFSVTARPTATGIFTNLVTVTAPNTTGLTNSVVTRVFAAQADLEMTLATLPPDVLVDDWVTCTLAVTNRGPDAASNVVLNASLPAQAALISVVPTNQAYTLTNGNLTFGLGTLVPGALTRLQLTLQPTNAGSLTLSGRVSAANLLDTNAANNSVTSALDVGSPLPGQLLANVVSPQHYNPQTGLMEQTIRLSNLGTQDVASARVIVSGLDGAVFNSVGTNSGNPFVICSGTLGAGQSIDLLLEYFVPKRRPVPDPTLAAIVVPTPHLTAPASSPPNITRVLPLAPGGFLIEFESVPGQSYTVLYSPEPAFTNALTAQPPIVAPADRVQWIDAGPPKTVSRPGDQSTRFYRVVQNP